MRALTLVLLTLFAGSAWSQPWLRPCPGKEIDHSSWQLCHGRATLPDGSVYRGDWYRGVPHGYGDQDMSDGSKYSGEFEDGEPHGLGTLTAADGSKFVGEYRKGRRDGRGVEYSASGAVLRSGRWSGSELVVAYSMDTDRFAFSGPHPEVLRRYQEIAKRETKLQERQVIRDRVANAQRWVKVFESPSGVQYIKAGSIVKTGHVRRVLRLQDNADRFGGPWLFDFNIESVQFLEEYDCARSRGRRLDHQLFEEPMGGGSYRRDEFALAAVNWGAISRDWIDLNPSSTDTCRDHCQVAKLVLALVCTR
jgi:hypothetical protein